VGGVRADDSAGANARMVDMLTECPSADVRQFILAAQTDLERGLNPALCAQRFSGNMDAGTEYGRT